MRKRMLAIATIAMVVAVVAAMDGPGDWVRRRAHDPVAEVAAADSAMLVARKADAARWAPGAFARGDSAYARAMFLHRRQQLRPWPFRDFLGVRDSLVAARGILETAAAGGREARAVRVQATEVAIRRADERIRVAGEAARQLPLAVATRSRLAQARARLVEARLSLDRGRVDEAMEAANTAADSAGRVLDRVAALTERFVDAARLDEWKEWISGTVAWSRTHQAPAIVVLKDRHELVLYDAGRKVAAYGVDLGRSSVNDKTQRGDRATPEGRYRVVRRKDLGESRYHRALLLDYPNREDRIRLAVDQAEGRMPATASLGGAIEIHGSGGRGTDWTDGCIALADGDLDRLFARVPLGTPVTIVGSDGMGRYSEMARRSKHERS